jgi:hypothetical protein
VKLYNHSAEIPLDFQEIAENSRFRLLDIHLEDIYNFLGVLPVGIFGMAWRACLRSVLMAFTPA